ncbi:ribosome small subunit-dependent GTPase A [Chloroflexota bacterium]
MTENSYGLLGELGWDSFFQGGFESCAISGSIPARIISEYKNSYRVRSEYDELSVKVSGKMLYQANTGDMYPAVGDWVIVKPQVNEKKGIIQAILPRKGKFSRKSAGAKTEEQVVAANVDTVFIVNGLDGGRNFNLRRVERYLTLAWNSGAFPVIVLNKMDLCPNVDDFIRSIEPVAGDVPVHPVSAMEKTGLDTLKAYITTGKTAAFLGSSGVGKSAIINALLGAERQEIRAVRKGDLQGRHTTTRRELVLIPGGGAVIDTPGMRELQMWANEDNLGETFYDIDTLADNCRFNDCRHDNEPGCAVRTAIRQGTLDHGRLESYLKLQKELRHLASREDSSIRLEEKAKWKKISQWAKDINKQGR